MKHLSLQAENDDSVDSVDGVHHALSCISLSRATPLGPSRYQTSEFPTTSEFPIELPTHMVCSPKTTTRATGWRGCKN